MAEERLFGNSIDNSVVNEIKKRERLLSKANPQGGSLLPDTEPNLNSLRYTTQRGAWVRMISSVDVKDSLDNNTFSPETSKRFILTGGEITSDGRKKEGISFTEFDTTKSYRKTATLGVRPEAGITSFSIKHKGTYGSLREAEISFNVWSKEDLNNAQNIYLRPGVHMIVEWGHTLDSDINSVRLPDTTRYFQASTRGAIQELINTHRKENLSYEGFIGLVTNFSWSFREDGGYDCSVKIISAGAVMESLTVINNRFLTSSSELKSLNLKDEDLQNTAGKSELHLFHLFLQKISFPSDKESNIVFRAYPANLKEEENLEKFPEAIRQIIRQTPTTFFSIIGLDRIDRTFGGKVSETSNKFRYISLRQLFMFLNETRILPNDTESTKFIELFTRQTIRKDNQRLSIEDEPVFRTMPEHFSLDPGKVLLPSGVPPSLSDNSLGISQLDQLGLKKELEQQTLNQITPPAIIPQSIRNIIGGINKSRSILDIFVELGYVVNIFDKFLTQVDDNSYSINVFSFLQELLKGINYYLGNVNNLDLHFDETLQKYKVVDRELIADGLSNINVEELSISGLSNTVSKVSIQTKITPLLSSQIAISAQGSSTLLSGEMNSNLPLIQWNANIEDRFNKKVRKPTQTQTQVNQSNLPIGELNVAVSDKTAVTQPRNLQAAQDRFTTIPTTAPSYLDSLLIPMERAYINFKKFTKPSYKEADFQKLHSKAVGYFKERIFLDILQEEDKTSDPGLIPIELSITLDGIGGLKIGQVFKLSQVDKFLPDVYKDYGFTITGLDNSIEDSKWNTTIRALTFKIPK